MFVILLIIGFFFVILFDAWSLLKTNQKKKTIIIYGVLIFTGFLMSLLQVIDKAPPSPVVLIENIVRIFIN
ncbi:hypothetical protein [Anaerosolibacter sp.]|uniref:hypothetical protein n=1 Tax=Anaerosolibacter sp. TaxID=1872527 RepID=UPI0039EF6F43